MQAAGFHQPVQVEVLCTQEEARGTTGLPGEVGPAVEGEMEAFFSRDLSSVLKGNRLDPQVLIQGRLSCKTARAIGTILREPPACVLSHRTCSQRVESGSGKKLRSGVIISKLGGGGILTGIRIQNQSEVTVLEIFPALAACT